MALEYKGWKSGISQGSGWPGTPKDTGIQDYGIYDPAGSGKVVSLKTGKPWNGKEPRTGRMFKNGAEVPPEVVEPGVNLPGTNKKIDPNNPLERFAPVDIVKSPAIATATAEMLDNFKKTAADSLKGFDEYLNEFKTTAADALKASKGAADITPTVNTLQTRQSDYDAALAQAAKEYATLNKTDAAAQRDIVDRANKLLPQFDTAAANIGNRQMQEVVKNLSRFKLGTGTPTSLGSDESRILAQGAADVLLPLEQAKIAKRYELLNNLELPIQRDITGRETARIASFNPEIAARQFASGQATAQTIQGLRERVASMSFDNAMRYMTSLGVPIALRQQILSGNLANLGQLAQLEDASHYRGLQDRLGVNLSQPEQATFMAPQYPAAPNYPAPQYRAPQFYPMPAPGLKAPNAPRTVTATTPMGDPRGAAPRYQADPTGLGYYDADTGDFYDWGQPAIPPAYVGDANLPALTYA